MLIYVLLAAALLLLFVEFFIVLRRRTKFSKREMAFVSSEWQTIRKTIDREPKSALISADRLIDYVLKKRGYQGNMGDKLKKAEQLFSRPDNIWHAHKLRNRSVHEAGFEPTEQEVRKALSYFKQALWDLGVKL